MDGVILDFRFCSTGHPHIGYEVSSKFAQGCKRRCHLKQNFAPPFACHVTYTSQVCVLVGKLQCCVWKISANKSRVYCCQFRDTLKIILFLIQFKNERLIEFLLAARRHINDHIQGWTNPDFNHLPGSLLDLKMAQNYNIPYIFYTFFWASEV